MYTQCPECLTIFEIDEEALQVSLGIVHCGHCAQRFDALRSLSDTLPSDPEAPLVATDTEPKILTLTSAVSPAELELAAQKYHQHEASTPAAEWSATSAATFAGEASPENVPGFDGNADWVVNLHTDLTDALIADAAGLARVDPDDDSWHLLDAPVQARFNELDVIPVTRSEPALSEPERDESPAVKTGSVPDDAGTALDQESGDRRMEIPPATTDDTDAGPLAMQPAGMQPAGSAGLSDDIAALDIDACDLARPAATTPAETETAIHEPESADADVVSTAAAGEAPAPLYVRPRQPRFSRAGVLWTLGCLVLAVTLAAQLAWAKRVALLQNGQTGAWVARVCANIPCQLPPIRDVAKLELLSRDIRPDPHTNGALVITATLRNNANFRQPWPIVTVELSDIDGRPVAMRRFRPAEYMPNAARRAAGIAAGATAALAFEVADPGKNAVSFQFSFE